MVSIFIMILLTSSYFGLTQKAFSTRISKINQEYILLNSFPTYELYENNNIDKNIFTFGFNLRIENFPKKSHSMMSLKSQNTQQRKNEHFKECLFSQEFLQQNPKYKKFPLILNNPNCQESDIKIKTQKFEILFQRQNDEIFLELRLYYQDKIEQEIRFKNGLKNEKQNIFIGLSIDNQKKEGQFYFENLNSNFQSNSEIKNFNFLMDQQLDFVNQLDFNQTFDENMKGEITGIIFYDFYFQNLDLLKYIDISYENFIYNNIYLDVIGSLDRNNSLVKQGPLQISQLSKLITKEKTIDIKNSPISLNEIIQNLEENSITFNFDIILDLYSEGNLLVLNDEDNQIKIQIKKLELQKDTQQYYKLQILYKDQKFEFVNKLQVGQNEFQISIAEWNQSGQIIYFKDNQIEKSPFIPNFEMKNLNGLLFQNIQLQLQRFSILRNFLPFLIKYSKSSNQQNQNCEVPLLPSYLDDKCYSCKNQVVNFTNYQCMDFCLPNHKNIGGVCIVCLEQNCAEIEQTKLIISRIENNQFLVSFTRPIQWMTSELMQQIFELRLDGQKLIKNTDYTYTKISQDSYLLKLNFKHELFNKKLSIYSIVERIPYVYDQSLNFVVDLNFDYLIADLRIYDEQSKKIINVIVYIIIVIFVLNIIAGILLVIYSIKNNTNELVTKKCVSLFQFILMIPFLMLYKISFPANVHYFLKSLYKILIANFEQFKYFKENIYVFDQNHSHPNFFDRSLNSNYLYNFGLIFIIHLIMLFLYGSLIILDNYFLNLSFTLRRNIKKMRKAFEYNILIIFILVFQSQIIIFSTLNLSSYKTNEYYQLFSQGLSIIYLIMFVLLISVFMYYYCKQHRFCHQSQIKYQISFLFIGYKNTDFANLFEILKILLTSGFLISLALLREQTFPQIGFSYICYFLYFWVLICIRPYENIQENLICFLHEGAFMLVLLLMLMLGVQEFHNDYNTQRRDLIGWLIIFLIFIIINIRCISSFIELYYFRSSLNSSSKLIFFYPEKTEMQSLNMCTSKYISKDKLYANSPRTSKLKGQQSYGNLGNLVNQTSLNDNDENLNIKEVNESQSISMETHSESELSNNMSYLSNKENEIFDRFQIIQKNIFLNKKDQKLIIRFKIKNINNLMGNQMPNMGGDKNQQPKKKLRIKPQTAKRSIEKPFNLNKLPDITPTLKCKLRLSRQLRVKDFLLIEQEFVEQQEKLRKEKEQELEDEGNEQTMNIERQKVEQLRGTPNLIGTLEEIVDNSHGIISSQPGIEYYVPIPSFVDRNQLTPGVSVLCHANNMTVVGVLQDDTNPLLNVMKVENAPEESYAQIGGLEEQIQEIKEAVELPLSHPEIYEDIGIRPPKGVILYGEPGTGKTLLVKAVAHETSATFLRLVGSELIQKYLGEGPKLVRDLFKTAHDNSPSIIFIDEIDAVGSKRFNSSSGGEREIQRTMLELLNQLDGFDSHANVKVIMATNKIESLDPALIRPGRIDRKIHFPLPDQKTLRKILSIHTQKMTLDEDVDLDEVVNTKESLTGADVKAICTEAGLLALGERRMKVFMKDFIKAKDKTLHLKRQNIPDLLYS